MEVMFPIGTHKGSKERDDTSIDPPEAPQRPKIARNEKNTTIVDSVQVFSYSKDATLKVWNAIDQVCLHTVPLKFPSAMFGRLPEQG